MGELSRGYVSADPGEGHDILHVALQNGEGAFYLAHLHEWLTVSGHDQAGVGLGPEALIAAQVAVIYDGVDKEDVDTGVVHCLSGFFQAGSVFGFRELHSRGTGSLRHSLR